MVAQDPFRAVGPEWQPGRTDVNKPVTPPNPNSPEARDIAHLMHPYTDARRHAEIGPLVIDRGEGVYVEDVHGNRYIEAMDAQTPAIVHPSLRCSDVHRDHLPGRR